MITVDVKVLREAIEGIDGGCGSCIDSFLKTLIPHMDIESYTKVVTGLEIYGKDCTQELINLYHETRSAE